jgi:ureidoacrylate peracid hydrolase
MQERLASHDNIHLEDEDCMHQYAIPEFVRERALRRKGKLFSIDAIDAARAALVVVDMQNHFVAQGFPNEVAQARDIVPNINRMAAAMRAAGSTVVWIQTTVLPARSSAGATITGMD